MRLPAALKWIGLALLGLLIATAVALAATSLISRQIGIDSESITAGDTLAPAFHVKAENETPTESEAEQEVEPAPETEVETEAEAEPRTETPVAPETQSESPGPTESAEPRSDDGEGGGARGGEGADD